MFNEMYYSDAFWKGDSNIVTKNLRRLDSEAKKRESLKENIISCVKGFMWKEYHITWTNKCKLHPISDLAEMMRKIIKE